MCNNLTPFEVEVMRRLLAGEDDILSALRSQLEMARVAKREQVFVAIGKPAGGAKVQ